MNTTHTHALQHTATHTPQHTNAPRCNTLHHTATHRRAESAGANPCRRNEAFSLPTHILACVYSSTFTTQTTMSCEHFSLQKSQILCKRSMFSANEPCFPRGALVHILKKSPTKGAYKRDYPLYAATNCNTLLHTVTHCITLQHTQRSFLCMHTCIY